MGPFRAYLLYLTASTQTLTTMSTRRRAQKATSALSMRSTNSADNALRIHSILDQIIWSLHGRPCRSTCCRMKQLDTSFTLHDTSGTNGCHSFEVGDLNRCLRVSKLWANVVIPQLWGYYANERSFLSLVTNMAYGWEMPPTTVYLSIKRKVSGPAFQLIP